MYSQISDFIPDIFFVPLGLARLSAGPAAVEIVLGGSHVALAARSKFQGNHEELHSPNLTWEVQHGTHRTWNPIFL